MLSECAGYQSQDPFDAGVLLANAGERLDVDVSFQGIACDAARVFESYCGSGVFDFFFHGLVDDVVFEESQLRPEGSWCASDPEGSCPIGSGP